MATQKRHRGGIHEEVQHSHYFEYPDEYYRASFEERSAMIRGLSKKVSAKTILSLLDRYIAFEKDEEARCAKQRFDDAVKEAVFELNVRKEVISRIADEEPPHPV